MEVCDMSQPRPKRNKKQKNSGVSACEDFKSKSTSGKRSLKLDIDLGGSKPVEKVKPQGAHMNVRDLGSDPGVVKPAYEMTADGQKRSSYRGDEGDEMAMAAEMTMSRRKKKK